MKLFLLAAVAAASLAAAGVRDEATDPELNVNSRYTVESIDFSNPHPFALSAPMREDLHGLVGRHLDVEALNRLCDRINEELRARSVTFRVNRGLEPARVRVTFIIDKRPSEFDVSLSGITYNSREGWTGTGQATLTLGNNAFTAAGLSNGDDLVERYSGVRARYDRLNVGSKRVRIGFEYDVFREQYDPATLAALPFMSTLSSPGAGAYRSRTNVEPSATFVLAKPVTLTVGFSFQKYQPQTADSRPEAANAIFSTLRYHPRWEGSGEGTQDLDASYRFRTAAVALGSDTVYTKHAVSARYAWRRTRQSVEVTVLAGVIYGQAPLFERFVLGTNTTLRGWNKFELDPVGGNRAVHASVTYGYRIMRVFYDTGSVWESGKGPEEKHSAGIGLNTGLGLFGKNALLIALAFPIRNGHAAPVVIAGMNF